MKIQNKKAQVGETITWIVATVIIVLILAVSIFVTNFSLKESKKIPSGGTDTLASKSFFSYILTKNAGGEIVYNQLKEEKNLNNFNGPLAVQIFKEYYGKEYQQVWVGISSYGEGLAGGTWNGENNDYFGGKPKTIAVFHGSAVEKDSFSNLVNTDEKTATELLFIWGLKG